MGYTFYFDGVDVANLGLEYAPELSNTHQHTPAKWKTHEQTFDAHDGGYFYGVTVQPKDFQLRCFYEDEDKQTGILTRVQSFFPKGRTGKLVFSNRNWCYYLATVISVEDENITNYMNGFVTITLRAYYPFARASTYPFLPNRAYSLRQTLLNNTGLLYMRAYEDANIRLPYVDMSTITDARDAFIGQNGSRSNEEAARTLSEALLSFDPNATTAKLANPEQWSDEAIEEAVNIYIHEYQCGSSGSWIAYPAGTDPLSDYNGISATLTSSTELYLYNPGTEMADVAIHISGDVGAGVIIKNHTTGQECKIVGLTAAMTSSASPKLVYTVDSLSGKAYFGLDAEPYTFQRYGYLYHDHGFIQLAPATPVMRNAEVSGSIGSKRITATSARTLPQQYANDSYMVFKPVSVPCPGVEDRQPSGVFIAGVTPSGSSATLDTELMYDIAPGEAMIAQLNHITIEPVTTMSITRLNFEFVPTYS